MARMISDELPKGEDERLPEGLFDGGDGEDSSMLERTYTDKVGIDLHEYPVDVLLGLRAEIDALLPSMKLSEVNLEEELMRQFHTARALQTSALADRHVETNKKAQVLNSVAATLQHLVKMQSEFFTAERFKKIEVILIDVLRDSPEEIVEEFMTRYEAALEQMK